MESSEDDAGAATIASRRASAREKDLGPSEEVDAAANASGEASRAQTPNDSGAMSEDNFDGDSVPSPSAHENNASTEAILDMIDEIVDGPGAPKRIPLSESDAPESVTSPLTPLPVEPTAPAPPATPAPREPSSTEQDAGVSQQGSADDITPSVQEACTSQIGKSENLPADPVLSPATSAECENASQGTLPDTPLVNISENLVPVEIADSRNTEPSPASSSVAEVCEEPAESKSDTPAALEVEHEVVSNCPPINIPSSSVEETVPSICEISECESNNRTVKHVTSSDNRDNVTVESAESTSSDTSVSEGRSIVPESATRSPLRRRLIRPTPYDRRPDTTVSSTVDSRASDSQATGQSSECVAKDVSSSSDVVPTVHGNVNEEANSNVSEISVCKAETSSSQAKKIRLVRQKITPSTSQSATLSEQVVTPESESPSTSSPSLPLASSSDCISTTEAVNDAIVEPSEDCPSDIPVTEQIIVAPVIESDNKLPVANIEKEQPPSLSLKESERQLPNAPVNVDLQIKIPPIKLNLSVSNASEPVIDETKTITSVEQNEVAPCLVSDQDASGSTKQIPKLTIKLSSKQPEEMKSPIPKLTIKPIKPPAEDVINPEKTSSETFTSITKINIKPITRPPEKINDIHRKSSSSEISESECSENDETSTSDQASTSDQGASEVIPKVTIKLGRPGTECEGKFYTEQNAPKLTITGLQQEESDSISQLKVIVNQSEQLDKIPKLTIKTVAKSDSQLSPKLTIKPIKTAENTGLDTMVDQCDTEVAKNKHSSELSESTGEVKEVTHVPKITIKPITKPDIEPPFKTPKKSAVMCDSPEHIPLVTKLNIKPIMKPAGEGETSKEDEEKVPVVSKLNIKPIIRPKDSEIDPSIDDVPKVTKLNIKPLKTPEEKSSEQKDCDVWNVDSDENSIPVVTKLNIKPILKPLEEENIKDSENQSSETGNSSDDNTDIPVVTKLNIKPILKPTELEDVSKPNTSTESTIPIVTKLNIKPIIKPEENALPLSPKKEIPVVTKLNIKPIVKPEETEHAKAREEMDEALTKNPPLVMKINIKAMADTACNENIKTELKINNVEEELEPVYNNINENVPAVSKKGKPIAKTLDNVKNDLGISHSEESHGAKDTTVNKSTDNCVSESVEDSVVEKATLNQKDTDRNLSGSPTITKENCLPEDSHSLNSHHSNDLKHSSKAVSVSKRMESESTNIQPDLKQSTAMPPSIKQTNLSNCTLLKKLLENKVKDVETMVKEPEVSDSNLTTQENIKPSSAGPTTPLNCNEIDQGHLKLGRDIKTSSSPNLDKNDTSTFQDGRHDKESMSKPLEINISEKNATQSSGQDSPRIILKINKTDHGSSAKIITEEIKKPEPGFSPENTQEIVNDTPKKGSVNSRRKVPAELSPTVALGKRLRSSRIVQESEKSPPTRRNAGKRPSSVETSPTLNKESELSVLETKRLKLGQLLSNKGLTVAPVTTKISNASPSLKLGLESKQTVKNVNHTLLNNENCSKNGNSKLHNILSNLQAKQIQSKPIVAINCLDKAQSMIPELDSSTSTGSSDVVEITPIENPRPQVQEMIINENSESPDFTMAPDDLSQDPLEVDSLKTEVVIDSLGVPFTPQPKKRGRPRKIPLSEGAKTITLPTPALEERPQRSLRLTRDRPAILVKPRGRGRGRGAKRAASSPPKEPEVEPVIETATNFFSTTDKSPEEIDPTSSRVKLPRMTEALDNMPSACTTPLSSRTRDSSSNTDIKMFADAPELKVVLENTLQNMEDSFMKSPETPGSEGRGRGRGRGGRARGRGAGKTPRARGRGRGGGRGAMYMKETMGIYGRVCGPATTTVHLFEEETCMMDDNATPAKPSHLLDEDSQSSVKSSTNESSKMRKSKFADLFDSNKVWTAADVKEYMWPPPENPSIEHQVMMIQEQVAMFLGVKSFKRRYPELKRRSVGGEERDYILRKGLVTEALCDLGITAVDASEVLDIMLSDYPHKYEEYRSHQRERQISAPEEPEAKAEAPRVDRVEMKIEAKPDQKPDLPKIDPEKTRQDMAAAAAASASEWNARLNSLRRGACADLQTMTVLRRRAAPRAPAPHCRPPAGFYPHALLPGQYQHAYRAYTPDQLRSVPHSYSLRRGACADLQTMTVLRRRAAPRAPAPHCRPPAGFYPHALLPGQYQHAYRAYTPDQLRSVPHSYSLRRGACADLQTMTVLRRRAAPRAPAPHCRPPAGFYPHALLPGQYQHAYRAYTPDQLRSVPHSYSLRRGACADLQTMTVLRRRAAPRAPAPHCRPPAGFYPHALLPGQYQHAYRAYTPDQLRSVPHSYSLRRGACADLQTMTVLRRRAAPRAPAPHCRPPAGFYPHALLPGQYQHAYRAYTPDQLRSVPHSYSLRRGACADLQTMTVLRRRAAPRAPAPHCRPPAGFYPHALLPGQYQHAYRAYTPDQLRSVPHSYSLRRGACADLQTMTVLRRRAAPRAPAPHCRPPAGFYPHALLPGQYQHAYRAYTPDQLRSVPHSYSLRRGACADLQTMTVLRRRAAPRAPAPHCRPPAGFYPHALLPGQYQHAYRAYTPDQLRSVPHSYSLRRGACADLQTMTVLRRRAAPRAPAPHCRPPAGFYPHALLPGQYQHAYRAYTPDQLRSVPHSYSLRRGACADLQTMTVLRRRAAPRAPAPHCRPPAGFYPHALLPGQYQHAYRAYTPDQLRSVPHSYSLRRGACADLQTMTVLRRRAAPRAPAPHCRPPAGFYPHALLPGQYQHAYRAYTPDQLRSVPHSYSLRRGACADLQTMTVLRRRAAPRAPAPHCRPPAGFYPHALLPGQYQHAYRAYTPDQLRSVPHSYSLRRGACADLQTMTVLRRRAAPRAPAPHCRPPAGFYPHALLPGQYQHAYRAYTPDQLRSVPHSYSLRRGACADLQTMTVLRRRAAPRAPAPHCRPPAGFYPHALLPGQYQHAYRAYTPDQLRSVPHSYSLRRGACADLQTMTVLRRRAAPRAPAPHCRPPAGFYPHALLPGQYQHAYRAYTPDQLRSVPHSYSLRRGACADLQTMTVLRRRAAPRAPAPHCRPPAGFYPHALLPGQYQHAYRAYTPDQLRSVPHSYSLRRGACADLQTMTVLRRRAAPRAPAPHCRPPAGFYPHALLPGQYQHAYRAYTPDQLRSVPHSYSLRRGACADLQTMTVLRRRAAPRAPAPHCRPPAGFYPHALLPGQYQHAYRAYTPDQLRSVPHSYSLRRGACADLQTMTVLRRRAAPRAPAPHCRPPAGFYPHALLPGQYQHAYRAYTPDQLRSVPHSYSLRRGACADLQTMTVLRRRAAPRAPAPHCRPPAGFYPHALLPGQYQHAYRAYTPDQLRSVPHSYSLRRGACADLQTMTVLRRRAAPRAPAPHCRPPAGFYPHALLPGQYQHAYRAYTPDQLRSVPHSYSLRRGACADLQTMTVLRRRAAPRAPAPHCRPPAGFYPHALLPGQYQHAYRAYTPDQLRYFPMNTAVAAPPAPPSASESSSESEPDWGSHSSSSDAERAQPAKRKKLTKVKRSSVVEPKEEPRDEELCRSCNLREEGNRKYSHERFLVCANCRCRLHPSCVELPADTIRKVREYAWQCAECKTCCACALPADDDKMLFCDLCDRGFHIYCVGLERVPQGRWHCVECAKCKSCGARDPGGLSAPGGPGSAQGPAQGSADWHHQTRRGPGGHKLYSHSLCTPCARAYRIGRYCPLCARSFIGPKGTMQLVICKLCDRQLHQECVRRTVSALNVLDYTCGSCRRAGISSRSAAARLAPRTIATLFMAKRRFNKYAHRQYLASRRQERAGESLDEPPDPAGPDRPDHDR